MSYDTEEQQIEKLKEWWSENGTPLVIGAVLGLAGFAGWKFWDEKQSTYQAAASDMYIKVTETLKTDTKDGLTERAQAVKDQYPDSSYAVLSALHLAKLAIDKEELDEAINELNWIIKEHADNELANIAKIRLARIYIQQDKANDALKLLDANNESGYYELAHLVKGDALLALGKKDEALTAYKIAKTDEEVVSRHPSLQFKIDQLSQPSTEAVMVSIAATTTPTDSDSSENPSSAEETTDSDSNNESASEQQTANSQAQAGELQ
ncbi:YfgM family protein [Aliikangiella maris]|uniref:Ancillary SecYEG translocon subunit n=2 Tax=Aliikangiella maris TaxID=3162458 RepID=A0ABV2BWF9_9GAMM